MKILVVVDAQNDFITGTLGSEEAQSTVPAIAAKIDEYMKNTDMVVFTQDTHYDNYMETNENKYLPVLHCLENSWGWEIDENLDIDAPHIQKYTFGCYELPEILLHLAESCDAKIEQIELCGFCTDICVISNALILKSVFAPMDIDIVVDAHARQSRCANQHRAGAEHWSQRLVF